MRERFWVDPAVERVDELLQARGMAGRIRELDDSCRTAAEAARSLAVDVAQIAKSIVFRGTDSRRAVVVVTRGDRRVDEMRLSDELEESVDRAPAEWVREITGFPIGGVSPTGLPRGVVVLVDAALQEFGLVHAAAGHPKAVFWASPRELIEVSQGRVVENISG